MSVMTDDPRAEALPCCEGTCRAGQKPVHEPTCQSYQYQRGGALRYRCCFCLREHPIDPFPGCCGDMKYEPIPEPELREYDAPVVVVPGLASEPDSFGDQDDDQTGMPEGDVCIWCGLPRHQPGEKCPVPQLRDTARSKGKAV